MGRWEPDARGRMIRAAMDLFAERGYEQTTAGDIAERAGVTERTFFRHFPDKREVLFDGSDAMVQECHDAITSTPSDVAPFEAALVGVTAAVHAFEGNREHAVRRSRIIEANPSLHERELLKLAAMTSSISAALGERGAAGAGAGLAAHSAVTVFQVAVARWVSETEPPGLVDCIEQAAAELRAVT